MHRSSKTRLLGALIFCLMCVTTLNAVERFHIESGTNPDYLPLALDTVWQHGVSKSDYPLRRTIQVVTPALWASQPGLIVRALNSVADRRSASRFSRIRYPDWTVEDDPVNCVILEWQVLSVMDSSTPAIFGAGFNADTVLVYLQMIQSDEPTKYLHLTSSDDTGTFKGWTFVLATGDYDFDGQTEAFVCVDQGRSGRTLYCIDLDDWRIEWTLPVASGINTDKLYPTMDSSNPGVIFATMNPFNGAADDQFDDQYSYLVIADKNGKLHFKQIVGKYPDNTRYLLPANRQGLFYLSHLSPETIESSDPETVKRCLISRIDASGKFLNTVEVSGMPSQLFTAPYGPDQAQTLFIIYQSNYIEIIDTNLTVIAVSDSFPQANLRFIGTMRISGEPDLLCVFNDGLYSQSFEKILDFSAPVLQVEPVLIDSQGNTVEIVVSSYDEPIIAQVRRKSAIELMTVFYHRNQLLMLSVLSALVLSVITLLVVRNRTKRRHELYRLHESARIAEEKYQQAKDMAGGFAHEIRNSLFPADSILTRLSSLNESQQEAPEEIRSQLIDAKEAVGRAFDITELIANYTRIDAQYNPEPVKIIEVIRKVFEANLDRINKQNVKTTSSGDKELVVVSSCDQLYIVFNNLLLNSLDAMQETHVGIIDVTLESRSDSAVVRFSDNGIGISVDTLNRVFETFYSTKPVKGTGLGLATTKKIIELYGGSIDVASVPNEYTTFEMSLKTFKSDNGE